MMYIHDIQWIDLLIRCAFTQSTDPELVPDGEGWVSRITLNPRTTFFRSDHTPRRYVEMRGR